MNYLNKIFTFGSIAIVSTISALGNPIETIKLGTAFPPSSQADGFAVVKVNSWLSLELPQMLEMMPAVMLNQINNQYRNNGLSDREVFRVHDKSEDFYFNVYISTKNTDLEYRAAMLDSSISDFEKKMLCWEILNQIEAQRPMDRKQKNLKAELISVDPVTIQIVFSRYSPATGERVVEEKRYYLFEEKTAIVNLGYSEKLSTELENIVDYFWASLQLTDPK